jgi:hypothetical protein
MARMETRNREVPDPGHILDAPAAASSWRPLYRAAGMAALVTAVLIPVHLAVFMAYPMPDTVTGWFTLLQDNAAAFSGLVLWVWYILIARRLLQLARELPASGSDR